MRIAFVHYERCDMNLIRELTVSGDIISAYYD